MTDHFSMPDKAINEMFQARSPMCIGLHGISALPASPTTAISPPPPRPLLVSSISGILSHGFPQVWERQSCLWGGMPPQRHDADEIVPALGSVCACPLVAGSARVVYR